MCTSLLEGVSLLESHVHQLDQEKLIVVDKMDTPDSLGPGPATGSTSKSDRFLNLSSSPTLTLDDKFTPIARCQGAHKSQLSIVWPDFTGRM